MENGKTIKSKLQVWLWRREDGDREKGRGKKEGKDIQIMMI